MRHLLAERLRACFENRPVRGPGLQGCRNRIVSCRPRALTRRFGGFLKHALKGSPCPIAGRKRRAKIREGRGAAPPGTQPRGSGSSINGLASSILGLTRRAGPPDLVEPCQFTEWRRGRVPGGQHNRAHGLRETTQRVVDELHPLQLTPAPRLAQAPKPAKVIAVVSLEQTRPPRVEIQATAPIQRGLPICARQRLTHCANLVPLAARHCHALASDPK